MSAALTFQAGAGTLFYVPIPAVGSDAQSGLDASKGYTNAVAAGTAKERSVNGVPFAPLSGAENVATANGVTKVNQSVKAQFVNPRPTHSLKRTAARISVKDSNVSL